MTSHAIDDAREDGTSYHTLQEGGEHKNKVDNQQARETFKGVNSTTDGETSWQYILNQQTLQLLLTFFGYAPPSHSLPTLTSIKYATKITMVGEIKPPKCAPTAIISTI